MEQSSGVRRGAKVEPDVNAGLELENMEKRPRRHQEHAQGPFASSGLLR